MRVYWGGWKLGLRVLTRRKYHFFWPDPVKRRIRHSAHTRRREYDCLIEDIYDYLRSR